MAEPTTPPRPGREEEEARRHRAELLDRALALIIELERSLARLRSISIVDHGRSRPIRRTDRTDRSRSRSR